MHKHFTSERGEAVGIVSAAGAFALLTFIFILAPIAHDPGIPLSVWLYVMTATGMALPRHQQSSIDPSDTARRFI